MSCMTIILICTYTTHATVSGELYYYNYIMQCLEALLEDLEWVGINIALFVSSLFILLACRY